MGPQRLGQRDDAVDAVDVQPVEDHVERQGQAVIPDDPGGLELGGVGRSAGDGVGQGGLVRLEADLDAVEPGRLRAIRPAAAERPTPLVIRFV